ncbi:MAG: YbjN domain-containing protein [Parachlamydiales bacterium]|jgi:hypothetical protein
MINVTLDSILELLEKNDLNPMLQEETKQVSLSFKLHDADFPMFIKVVHEGDLIQVLQFIPAHLDKNHVSDVARLMHYLNKEMDLPGFGFDENNQMMFFRLVLPTAKHKVDPDLLLAFINAARIACETFAPMIQNVNLGRTRFKEILEKTTL